MGAIKTNSALATLEISKTIFDQDILLQWICQIASPLQLTVKLDNNKKSSILKLEAQSIVLTCRNAILRAICGSVLHGALDQYPYYLLGGNGHLDAIKFAQTVQWMSVADTMRGSQDDKSSSSSSQQTFLPTLEKHLQSMSFLTLSSQPSLCDYDLALVLNSKLILDDKTLPAVQRWYKTVIFSIQRFAKSKIALPISMPLVNTGPLTFYYGVEDVSAVLKPPTEAKAKGTPAPGGGGKNANKKDKKQKEGGDQTSSKQQSNQEKKGKKQSGNDGGGGGGNQPATVDISALDIRVGKIIKAWHHEEADKLFCEDVDLGTETRQIASGLRPFYQTEDLQGRLVLVLCNLKKRSLVGFPSHGMVLCASNADHTKVEFVIPPEGSKPGDRVIFEGYETGTPEPENKVAKKKIFETLAPDLKTDDNGTVIWKTAKAKTDAGYVKALNGMPHAKVS